MKLYEIIDELVEERGLDRAVLSDIVCEGILAAYQKKYPDLRLKVEYDSKSGEAIVLVEKEIVTSVQDENNQISLKKARYINKKLTVDQKIWVPFEGEIGRIEILKARQIIANKIRKVEAQLIYDEFKEKEGEVVHGTIHKCERSGMVVKLDDALAFLPRSLTSPTDKCMVGFSIRALLKEVLPEERNDNQLILDRVSEKFLYKLFELEIPEVFERIVEVKKIVRVPGYKSKIAVISHNENIDPVGTCVGVRGSRIQPILKELGGEKIDVIAWTGESPEELIRNSLKPARINRVEIVEEKVAKVWLDEDQRSLAIGRMGQNISLASRLVGFDIQLVQEAQRSEKEMSIRTEVEEEEVAIKD